MTQDDTQVGKRVNPVEWIPLKAALSMRFGSLKGAAAHYGCTCNAIRHFRLSRGIGRKLASDGFLPADVAAQLNAPKSKAGAV